MHINFLVITSVMLLGGCASGATEFTCGEFPQGKCQPVSSSYEASNGDLEDYDYRESIEEEATKVPRATLKAKAGTSNPVVTVNSINTSLNHAVSGDPIYSKPVVLRILFNDWEDENGNLHSRNYIYQVVKESKWLIVN